MSLLNELLNESAAGGAAVTSAGNIAGFRGFIGKKRKSKKTPMKRRSFYGFKVLGESENSKFDPNDVISKLKSDARSAPHEDSVAFALEDEKGNLVKVWVPKDQSDDFQDSLQSALTPSDDEEESYMDVAEIIFKLKDDFDIIDVNWDEIEEDEEEPVETPEGEEGSVEGGEEGVTGLEGEGEGGEEEMMAGEEDAAAVSDQEAATSSLQQVIDMMKADADAKKAEADAKTAEAKAKQAQHAVDLANIKMKGEEEVLDMEDYYSKQKRDKEEADKLTKMARYRHDVSKDNGNVLGSKFESKLELGNKIQEALRKSRG